MNRGRWRGPRLSVASTSSPGAAFGASRPAAGPALPPERQAIPDLDERGFFRNLVWPERRFDVALGKVRIGQGPHGIRGIAPELWADRRFALEAVKLDWELYCGTGFISDELCEDREVALAALAGCAQVDHNCSEVLDYLPVTLAADPVFRRDAQRTVKELGESLGGASDGAYPVCKSFYCKSRELNFWWNLDTDEGYWEVQRTHGTGRGFGWPGQGCKGLARGKGGGRAGGKGR